MPTTPDLLSSLHAALTPHAADGTPGGPSIRSETSGAAAVLVLLFPRHDGLRFLLTVRPDTLTRHPGQISLPGGRVEKTDSDLWQTAVRETREELGVDDRDLVPLGRLDRYRMPVSGYAITPFVGCLPCPPALHPDPGEVAEVIEVPLAALLDESTVREEIWDLHDRKWHVTFYLFGEHRVWGATATILADLASRLGAQPRGERPGAVRAQLET